MPVPPSMHKHRLAFQIEPAESVVIDAAISVVEEPNENPIEICQRLQRQLREVLAVRVPMERAVHVCPGIRDHVDPADLEFRPLRVVFSRILTAQKIANHRRRKSGIRHQTVFDIVADVYKRLHDNTCGSSRIESITREAPSKSSAAVKELRMITHSSPAARAAASPRAESSITRASSGWALNLFRALR